MRPGLSPRWLVAPPQEALAGSLAAANRLSRLLAQCLLNRGFSDPSAVTGFLDPRLRHLADPFLIPDMAVAVDRLLAALPAREPIVIFGDYDVDGVTATTLLCDVMRALGWVVDTYLPHRMEEGYGLSQVGVENCIARHPTRLILAVDCGSTAVAPVAWLRQRGIDVVVLDHHQISTPAPDAIALVNPQRIDPVSGGGRVPLQELCSVGLAFKLAHALLKRGRDRGLPGFADLDLRPFLDLVALGTIADIVPLVGENRILVTAGLERLRQTTRPGLVALKEVAKVSSRVEVYEVGYQLAPRLNAAGRLETANEALQLLMTRNPGEAASIAASLDSRNRERQQIERSISEDAIGGLHSKFDPARDFVIVEGRLSWHIGVVGIVASRVLREFYRPTIILGGDGAEWRGSGRSVRGFDLAAALRECGDLLVKHGGHAMAAGVTISPDRVDHFRDRLNSIAQRQLSEEMLRPELRLDAEVHLDDLSIDQIDELGRMNPFGQENPDVQVCVRGVTLARPIQRMGKEQQHARLAVTAGRGTTECVWWSCAGREMPAGRFDIAVVPSINEFNGRRSVQLKLLDWRPSTEA